MDLLPGSRWSSTTCSTQVVIVKGDAGVDLRCGGAPMAPAEEVTALVESDREQVTLLGKRYASEDGAVEVLCTRSGAGIVSIGTVPLVLKGAKPLPSSD